MPKEEMVGNREARRCHYSLVASFLFLCCFVACKL